MFMHLSVYWFNSVIIVFIATTWRLLTAMAQRAGVSYEDGNISHTI